MLFMKHAALLLTTTLFLSACGSTGINLATYRDSSVATPQQFTMCHGQGCTTQTRTGFTKGEWAKISALFKPKAKNAGAEREQIKKAIAMMERFTGARVGTKVDKAEAKAPKSDIFQMDCIDETANTTQYLELLARSGHLKWHRVTAPVHRGYFVDGAWPHNTATITDQKSGGTYVVDSFYFDNGHTPVIIPAKDWLAGWKPKR